MKLKSKLYFSPRIRIGDTAKITYNRHVFQKKYQKRNEVLYVKLLVFFLVFYVFAFYVKANPKKLQISIIDRNLSHSIPLIEFLDKIVVQFLTEFRFVFPKFMIPNFSQMYCTMYSVHCA